VTQAILPRLKTVGVNLTAEVEKTVYTCPNNFTSKVDLIFVANNTNGNKTVTITWHDHTTNESYNIAPEFEIGGYEFLKLSDAYLILNSRDELRFTSSAGANMSVIVSIEEYFDPANANGS
jgi:hypothetical protein